MSSALLWQLTRKHGSFKLHNRRQSLCKAKGSLNNLYTPRDMGLIAERAVDVSDENGTLILSLKSVRERDIRKPQKMYETMKLKGGVRKAMERVEKKVGEYHPALKKAALKRTWALLEAQKRAARLESKGDE